MRTLKKERVIAPSDKQGLGQVMNPEDLKIGKTYWFFNKGGGKRVATIMGKPTKDEKGDLWVKVKWGNTDNEFSLADAGIVPYTHNGLWNEYCFTVLDP